jgi:hypothetical protein
MATVSLLEQSDDQLHTVGCGSTREALHRPMYMACIDVMVMRFKPQVGDTAQ